MNKVIPSFDQNRSVLGKILPLQAPFNVIIDASECCNFRCSYCFRAEPDKGKWGYARRNDLMSWEDFEIIVEQLKAFQNEVRQISLSGHGEPLCNRMLPQMVQYLKKQGIQARVSIHTNASLLDRKYAEELAEAGIDKVVVSLQGLSDQKYWDVCQARISFENLYQTCKYFYSIKKENTQIYYKIMDVALEKGEENEFYERFLPIGDRAFIEQSVPIWKGIGQETGVVLSKNKYGESFPLQKCCPLIFHTIVIGTTGDVYPCTQLLREDTLGNIHNNTLYEMWHGLKRKKLLRKQCLLSNPPICEDCYIRQNSIYSKEDMIDEYRKEILERLN